MGAFKFKVFKVNANGTLNTSFGSSGVKTTTLGATGTTDITTTSIIGASNELYLVGVTTLSTGGNLDVAVVAYTSSGSSYTSFNSGTQSIDIDAVDNIPIIALLNTDGTLTVTGDSTSDFFVLKFDNNGQPDNSYGNFGITVAGSSNTEELKDAKMLADGSLLLAGTGFDTVSGADSPVLVKIDPTGVKDNGFASLGIYNPTTISLKNYSKIHVLSSGKILAIGEASVAGAARGFGLQRLEDLGTPDTTFAPNGLVVTDIFAAGDDTPDQLVVTGSHIWVGGIGVIPGAFPTPTQRHMTLVRYNLAGALDTTFATTGKKTSLFGNNGGNLNSTQKPHIFADGAALQMGWLQFSGQQNNIVMYKILP